MIIYVMHGGETWTLNKPTPIVVTPEQLTRIEAGEKIYNLIPDWDKLVPPCNCVTCTKERRANYLTIKAQKEAKGDESCP